jgi:hypothetical protein
LIGTSINTPQIHSFEQMDEESDGEELTDDEDFLLRHSKFEQEEVKRYNLGIMNHKKFNRKPSSYEVLNRSENDDHNNNHDMEEVKSPMN